MRSPLASASAALLFLGCATSPPPKPPEKAPPVEVKATGTAGEVLAVQKQSTTATVKTVDVAERAVTLEWAGGRTGTFKVSPEVTAFDDLYAGDAVQVDVEQQLRLEYQPPGAASVPLTVAGGTIQATAGGALTSTGMQATLTVAAIDASTRIVKLQDPAGATYEVKVAPGLNLEKLQVGDRFLATYVEARAVRLDKAAKKP